MFRTLSCVVAACLLAPVSSAQFTNGSFENGFTGWTLVDIPTPHIAMTTVTAGFDPGFGMFLAAPTDGTFAAMNGYDGGGPGSIILWQEVTVSGGTIDFDWRAGFDLVTYCNGCTGDRTFSVHIEPAGGGSALQTDLIHTAVHNTQNFDTGPMSASVDVSAFSGQTVRVVFDWWIPENFTGPGACQVDNVRFGGPAGPALQVVGTCGQPGSGVQALNMTPNGTCGFAASPSSAGITVPAGPCGQVMLGLGNPLFVVGFALADGSGTATVLPSNGIPAQACGWNMQAIDLTSCTLTNVIVL